jgi:hypothetical protein
MGHTRNAGSLRGTHSSGGGGNPGSGGASHPDAAAVYNPSEFVVRVDGKSAVSSTVTSQGIVSGMKARRDWQKARHEIVLQNETYSGGMAAHRAALPEPMALMVCGFCLA